MRVYGWKWETRPVVGDYAGNKTPIPSNPVSMVPAEATAYRQAGGWDVDRIFVDLGAPGFLEAMFSAAAADLANKSEGKVGAALLADATAAAAESVPQALSVIGRNLGAIGAAVSFVSMSVDLWDGYLAMTSDEAPWWLSGTSSVSVTGQDGSLGGQSIWCDPELPAGTMLGGDRRAATYFEAGQPVRITAQNIPNGGVDIGLFSYAAMIINDPRALVAVTVTAPAPPPEADTATGGRSSRARA
jgi:hypothetical protein